MPRRIRSSRYRGAVPLSLGVALIGGVGCEASGTRASVASAGDVEAGSAVTPPGEDSAKVGADVVAGDTSIDREVEAMLAATAVYDDAPARATLYTWTTTAQISALRADADSLLLTRRESPDNGLSAFDQALAKMTPGDPGWEVFAKADGGARRFAWPTPWATLLGTPVETYGEQLIRIQLRPDSIVASLDAETKRWKFFELSGAVLSPSQAWQQAERLAAVYHTAAPPNRYREYVLCNELQIESWSYAGASMTAELSAHRTVLERLLHATRAKGGPRLAGSALLEAAEVRWSERRTPSRLADVYVANLALVSELYDLEPRRVAGLLERFDQVVADLRGARALERRLDRDVVRRAVRLRREAERKTPRAKPARQQPLPGSTFLVTY